MNFRRFIAPWLFHAMVLLFLPCLHAAELFPTGSDWNYYKGQAEASSPDAAAWREPSFEAANWLTGPTPLFYGKPLTGSELADMRGGYSSVFLRRTFLISTAAEVSELRLGTLSDDGFIAWINGREVARFNVPEGPLPFNATALDEAAEPVAFETSVITNAYELLLPGANTLAVQAFNASLTDDSDFVIDASVTSVVDNEPPILEELIPAPGSTLRELFTVEVHFSEAVQRVEASDLLINGVAATNVTEVELGKFVFSFPQPSDGPVSVAWRADHGITDRSGLRHAFSGGAWTYTLESLTPAPGVLVSEFMADNSRTLNDENGDSSDWIEIFNSGETAASLDGWFLTDTTNNLAKWRFPDITIPAKGYLLVFASEKNRTNVTGRLHTNFKLATEGEYLALVSPATNVISAFAPAYPKQFTDVSYGRVPGTPETVGFFIKATPGLPNSARGPGFAPEVEFSSPSGTFRTVFNLTLSTGSSNLLIHYTLDGNVPTNSSPAYVAPIRITNSMQVRARAYQDGLLPGPPHSETYLMLSNNLVNFTSTLPVLVIHSLGKGAPTSSRQNFAHLSLFEPVNGWTSLTNPPTLTTRSGIKIRGSSTEGIAKSSFAVEFWNEFNQDEERPILGLPADSDWVLYAPNQFEPVLIHNPFIHQLSRDMGRYSPRTRFVEVYLNRGTGQVASNHYSGIYVLEEKISIGKNRVDIDKLEPEHLKPPEVTGGYLLKIDRLDPGDGGFLGMAYVDPKEPEIELAQRDPQEQYIKNYFNAFSKALSSTNWRDTNLGYPAYIDVDAWIEFHVLEVLSGSVDALVLSTYFHKPRNGKIVFGPHWDFDRALGSTDGRDSNPRVWNTGPFFSGMWWPKLFSDKDFWQKWVDRWQDLRRTHFALTNLHSLIDRQTGELREAQPREKKKWNISLRGGGTYQGEINLMKNWLSNRMDFIDKQLTQPPRLSATGGPVAPGFIFSLSGPVGASIYYTLEGSDPRLSQGNVSPKATLYSGPVQVQTNVRVVARAQNLNQKQSGGPPASTPWSAPVAATFFVSTPPLQITEIMFHPAPPPAGSTNSASDFEFIELKNAGSAPLNLAGIAFTNGITFTFTQSSAITNLAPGERLLLVRNRAAFLSRYPGATNIAGEFGGSLANSGNRLALVGPLLEPIFDFAYQDTWARLADGFGFSLVLADETTPAGQLGDSARWRLSARLGGSPGQADAAPAFLPPVLITEALTHTDPPQLDAIELFNPTSNRVDLGGWFLTDDFRAPKKFRIPEGRWIDGQSYLVFDESQFRTNENGFSLSSLGDEVYLFSADAQGNLNGYVHGFKFGAALNGVSFGLYRTSDGQEHFVAQEKTSLGLPNAGPSVGPVVISEIMYQPPPLGANNNTSDEFIELHNTSAQAVPLYDPAHLTNTWHVRGAVDFDFPVQTVLPPNGHLVLVGFDPASDPSALAAFQSRYALDFAAAILGPWQGHLNNGGDEIRLLKTDEPEPAPSPDAGFVPYVLAEQIAYSGQSPWPTNTAGTGLALVRRDERAFGDDPANWLATPPSPGDADADADGLPDRWEASNGLNANSALGNEGAAGDPDGDGFTNVQELFSGTLPNNAESFLRLEFAREASGGSSLSFATIPGRTYSLLYKTNLTSAAWQLFRSYSAAPASGFISVNDIPANLTRYYRLQVP